MMLFKDDFTYTIWPVPSAYELLHWWKKLIKSLNQCLGIKKKNVINKTNWKQVAEQSEHSGQRLSTQITVRAVRSVCGVDSKADKNQAWKQTYFNLLV